ncbi:MAG: hypothetical protein H8E44_35465 [Planctomycetes bacterium]|nr:hypothetical protein [Planctomycetota bacterium]MBL7038915.1 hypothetical protein [Pirellulaceae bacterium]
MSHNPSFAPPSRGTSGLIVKNAISMVLFLCILLIWCTVASAELELLWSSQKGDEDENYKEVWNDAENNVDVIKVYKDGNLTTTYIFFHNPNPEEGAEPEPGDEHSKEALAKQKGKKLSDAEELKSDLEKFEESPVGKSQTSKGKGYRVVSNPADEVTSGDGDGDSSDDSSADLFGSLKFEIVKISPHEGQGAEGFDPTGESMSNYVKGLIKKGDQGDDGGDSTPPGWQATQWKTIPPELAEIFNPNPEEGKTQGFLLMPAHAPASGKAGHVAKKASSSLHQVLRGLGAFGPGGARPAAPRPPTAARPVR